MTTYQQNTTTINVDICTVPAEACAVDLDCLLESFKRIMSSGVVCGILQCILEAGQAGAFDWARLLALLVKAMRTIKALLPQFNVTFGIYLRTVQNFLENLTAVSAKSQATFTKRILGPSEGLNSHVRTSAAAQAFKLAAAA